MKILAVGMSFAILSNSGLAAPMSCDSLNMKIMNAQNVISVVCPEVAKTLKGMDEYKNIIIPAHQKDVDQAKAAVAGVNAQIKTVSADVAAKLKIRDADAKDCVSKGKIQSAAVDAFVKANKSNSPQLETFRVALDKAEAELRAAQNKAQVSLQAWDQSKMALYSLTNGDLNNAKTNQALKEAALVNMKKAYDVLSKDNLPYYKTPCTKAQNDVATALKDKVTNKCP